ncbi:ATP-binding response regulator [Acidovorax sp. NCPPB 3576]|uniref:ATP-binding response regulator n=1 Tax=Acidovorax sp. NCPPB 3576 TaxID=2940488 RepID=UPI0023492005|nr:histidine kinase dimerization/phospho-acceptor domain-containing protein [Acidovorax sp. NCPPB 3576]WCM86352.1 hypothetical protein M5C98_13205 [Acidovorax sp. NCPPB 3576]
MKTNLIPYPKAAPGVSAEAHPRQGPDERPPPARLNSTPPQWPSMAGVGHELRTPLGALSAALEVIALAANHTSIQNEACAVAVRQTRHLSLLMEDLQDVLAAREGRLELRCVAMDFSELVRQAWEAMVNSSKGYAYTQQIAPNLRVMADPRLMRRAVDRLLWRAHKAAAPGMRMDLTVSTQGGEVRLDVRGLPKDNSGQTLGTTGPFPLDLHLRAGAPATLADLLADHVIQLHGGRLASSTDESGRYLGLPCLGEAPPRPARSRRPKVLVALQDARNRETVVRALEQQGYSVLEGAVTQPALDLLLQNVPDLVLTGAQPAQEARQLAAAAREAGYAGRMVVVAAASPSTDEALDAGGARRAGFDAWMAWADLPQALTAALESGND